MMDVWLALFSEPKKDKFKPELSLTYFRNKSLFQNRPDSHFDGSSTRAQVWLTNLISSQVGIRTLNIDLGGEFQREEHTLRGGLEPSVLGESNSRRGSSSIVTVGSWSPASQTSVGPTLTAGGGGKSRLQSFMENLRLFGKHIQDSALVIKYGEYRYQGFDPTGVELRAPISQRGPLLGAELTLYVSSWLGLSGQYQSLGLEPSGVRQGLLSGSLAEGQAFIEVSILRLVAGSFVRQWASRGAQKNEEARAGPDTKQTGAFTGLQLQL